jgi:hypothetical protein
MPLIRPAEPTLRAVELFERRSGQVTSRRSAAGPARVRTATTPSPARLRAVLRAAMQASYRLWPPGRHGDYLSVLVAAFAVAGLPPGLYLALRPDAALLPLPAGGPGIDALRPQAQGCDALLLVCGNVPEAASDGGYGGLLVRAGALGHLLCMSAATLALASSADPASCPQVTHVIRQADAGLRHLLTVAIRQRGSEDA